MRNKKTFKYAVFLAAMVPFLAFSLVLANHEEGEASSDDSTDSAMHDEETQKPDEMTPAQRQKAAREAEMKKRSAAVDGDRTEEEGRAERVAKRRVTIMTLSKMMENQVNRAERAIARLDQIMERIQSRRDKVAAKAGADMTKVDALIVQAETQKDALEAAILKAKSDWDAFKAADTEEEAEAARAAGKAFMTSIRDVNKKLIAFHKSLSEVVQALKRAEPKPEPKTPAAETEETNN